MGATSIAPEFSLEFRPISSVTWPLELVLSTAALVSRVTCELKSIELSGAPLEVELVEPVSMVARVLLATTVRVGSEALAMVLRLPATMSESGAVVMLACSSSVDVTLTSVLLPSAFATPSAVAVETTAPVFARSCTWLKPEMIVPAAKLSLALYVVVRLVVELVPVPMADEVADEFACADRSEPPCALIVTSSAVSWAP